jgi:hypothetical protein
VNDAYKKVLLQGQSQMGGPRAQHFNPEGPQCARYPNFVLQLQIPENDFDVLVEPDKSKVVFKDIEKIQKCVNDMLLDIFAAYHPALTERLNAYLSRDIRPSAWGVTDLDSVPLVATTPYTTSLGSRIGFSSGGGGGGGGDVDGNKLKSPIARQQSPGACGDISFDSAFLSGEESQHSFVEFALTPPNEDWSMDSQEYVSPTVELISSIDCRSVVVSRAPDAFAEYIDDAITRELSPDAPPPFRRRGPGSVSSVYSRGYTDADTDVDVDADMTRIETIVEDRYDFPIEDESGIVSPVLFSHRSARSVEEEDEEEEEVMYSDTTAGSDEVMEEEEEEEEEVEAVEEAACVIDLNQNFAVRDSPVLPEALSLMPGGRDNRGGQFISEMKTITRYQLQHLEFISQLDTKYLIARAGDVLFGIDQHAADERVMLEAYEEAVAAGRAGGGLAASRVVVKRAECAAFVPNQELCPPTERTIGFSCAETIERSAILISTWGFQFQLLHGRELEAVAPQNNKPMRKRKRGQLDQSDTHNPHMISVSSDSTRCVLRLTHTPVVLSEQLRESDFMEYIKYLGDTTVSEANAHLHNPPAVFRILASKSCRNAKKFGEVLSDEECENIIRSLGKTKTPFQCAHGRPTVFPLLDISFLTDKSSDLDTVRRKRPDYAGLLR